jgi:hypothetical protein
VESGCETILDNAPKQQIVGAQSHAASLKEENTRFSTAAVGRNLKPAYLT